MSPAESVRLTAAWGSGAAHLQDRPRNRPAIVIRRRMNAAPMPPSQKQLRLLVVSGNLALLRGHYDEVIASLARAGVDVRIRYVKENLFDPAEYAAAFQSKGLDVSVERLPRPARRPADFLSLRLRQLGNVLRFSHPDYAGRTVLSERALLKTDPGVQRWGKRLRRLGNRRSAAAARFPRPHRIVAPGAGVCARAGRTRTSRRDRCGTRDPRPGAGRFSEGGSRGRHTDCELGAELGQPDKQGSHALHP